MNKYTIVWHAHHECNSPLEFLDESYASRLKTIKTEKAKEESPEQIAVRLRLFKKFNGKLPVALDAADAAWVKTCAARVKACAAWVKACAAWDKACAARDKACAAWDKACAAWDKAIQDAMPEIMKLHAIQCGCGWTPERPNIFYYTNK